MTIYRIYVLEDDGHIRFPPEILQCEGDDVAIAEAARRLNRAVVEVWDGARRVIRLDPISTETLDGLACPHGIRQSNPKHDLEGA